MGKFYLHCGSLRPSRQYLQTHELPDYDPDDDWYNDFYDVNDDDTVLYEPRTCDCCGRSFTLYEALSDYADHIDWPSYGDKFSGEYCGNCAAEIVESEFN